MQGKARSTHRLFGQGCLVQRVSESSKIAFYARMPLLHDLQLTFFADSKISALQSLAQILCELLPLCSQSYTHEAIAEADASGGPVGVQIKACCRRAQYLQFFEHRSCEVLAFDMPGPIVNALGDASKDLRRFACTMKC